MASIASVTSSTLDTPPSCIEFSAIFCDIFVVGTYLLRPSQNFSSFSVEEQADHGTAQTREGQLIYFRLTGDDM